MGTTSTKLENNGSNGWAEYRRLVISELERLDEAIRRCDEDFKNLPLALTRSVAEVKEFTLNKLREERISIDSLLHELEEKSNRMDRQLQQQNAELTGIKARAGLFGAVCGAVIAILGVIATYLSR
jgi:chromosome segregation ATPase